MNVGVVSTFAECCHYRLRAQEHESSIYWPLSVVKSGRWVGFFLCILVSSSGNKNPLIWLDEFVITSFMAMRNRLTLRTDPCGMPFCMILDEERWFASLTWMVLVWGKILMKLKVLFLIPCICRSLRLRYLHTIWYTFPMSDIQQLVFVGWQRFPVSRFLDWVIVGGMELPEAALKFGDQVIYLILLEIPP